MHTKKKQSRLFLFIFLLLLVFIIINLFFYSLISIGLYKFICYEKQSTLLEAFTANKNTNMFYFLEYKHDLFFITNHFFYIYYYNFFMKIEMFSFFFNTLTSTKIDYFFFFYKIDTVLKKELNLIFLNFYIRSSNLNWVQAISLQKTIIINFNESSLFFFRIYNPSHICLKLITLYMIYPNILTLYVNKIQCFCFNTIFLYPLELVDLPVLVYIYPFLNTNFVFLNNIIIYYIIFLN